MKTWQVQGRAGEDWFEYAYIGARTTASAEERLASYQSRTNTELRLVWRYPVQQNPWRVLL